MTNARLRQIGKERAIELEESGAYQEERDEAFTKHFKDVLMPSGVNTNLEKWSITEDDIQGFLDSFEFPDEEEWIASKVESEYGDYMDQAYDQMRDDQLTGD